MSMLETSGADLRYVCLRCMEGMQRSLCCANFH